MALKDLFFVFYYSVNLLQHVRVMSRLVYLDPPYSVVVTHFCTIFIQYIGIL
jgi:16S rRNA G966 N2-methylase RsmD